MIMYLFVGLEVSNFFSIALFERIVVFLCQMIVVIWKIMYIDIKEME